MELNKWLSETMGEKLAQVHGKSVPEVMDAINKVGKQYSFRVTAGGNNKWTAIWPDGKKFAVSLPEVLRALIEVAQEEDFNWREKVRKNPFSPHPGED